MSSLATFIAELEQGRELSPDQVAIAVAGLASPEESEEAKGSFLTALARKGETAQEIAAFAREFRERSLNPGLEAWAGEAIDVVGTGGDHAGGFNISSLVVLTLASAGVKVMKHGNRGITSKCGSADLLAGLGYQIEVSTDSLPRTMEDLGYVFLFAPAFHPTFKHIGPVRKALAAKGQRTIFNILGPLINPGRPAHAIIGVFSDAWVPRLAEAAHELGLKAGFTAHGRIEDGRGIDELTTATPNRIRGFGRIRDMDTTWEASDHGFPRGDFSHLLGGDLAHNLAITRAILKGDGPESLVDTIAFNAAAGMWLTGKTGTIKEGGALARELLLGGAVARKIEQTRDHFGT